MFTTALALLFLVKLGIIFAKTSKAPCIYYRNRKSNGHKIYCLHRNKLDNCLTYGSWYIVVSHSQKKVSRIF